MQNFSNAITIVLAQKQVSCQNAHICAVFDFFRSSYKANYKQERIFVCTEVDDENRTTLRQVGAIILR